MVLAVGEIAKIMAGHLQTDRPLEKKKELTDTLKGLVGNLHIFLCNPTLQAPVLLAGDWGSGKTSVLRVLKKQLEGKLKGSVAWFDAWHYQDQDHLFEAMCAGVIRHIGACIEETEVASRQAKAAGFKKRARRLMSIVTATAARVVPALLTPVLGKDLAKGLAPEKILELADKLNTAAREKAWETTIDPVEELHQAFSETVDFWAGCLKVSRQPMVVLIDDLDRCRPDKAIALLDQLRLLVGGLGEKGNGTKPVRFVLALDRDLVVEAISQKFAGIRGFDGNRYLEKVFPYCFFLPTGLDQDAVTLLEAALKSKGETTPKGKKPPKGKTAYSLDPNARNALEEVLMQPFFANPRLIKRTVNRFKLYLLYSTLREFTNSKSEVPQEEQRKALKELKGHGLAMDKTMSSWLAAGDRWPLLRQLLQRRDEDYWRDMAAAVSQNDERLMPGPDALALLKQPAALSWLKQEKLLTDTPTRDTFREIDKRLRSHNL